MYRSLLVPLDGSTFAEHALPLALSIARRAGATLRVAQVHVPFALMYADSMSPFAYEAEAAVMEQERAYLERRGETSGDRSAPLPSRPLSWRGLPSRRCSTAMRRRMGWTSS